MKALIFGFIALTSVSAFAVSYDCEVSEEALVGEGWEEGVEMTFFLETREDGTAILEVMGDLVSDECTMRVSEENEDETEVQEVLCHDDEGMPYNLKIFSDTKVSLQAGYFPELEADCNQ